MKNQYGLRSPIDGKHLSKDKIYKIIMYHCCYLSCKYRLVSQQILTMLRKSRGVMTFRSQLSLSRMARSIRVTSDTVHPHSVMRTNSNVIGIT